MTIKASSRLSSLKKRILTALILLPVALVALFELPLYGFAIFSSLVLSIGAWEWAPFIGFRKKRARGLMMVGLLATFTSLYLHLGLHLPAEQVLGNPVTQITLAIGAVWWLIASAFIVTYPRSSRVWAKVGWLKAIFGLLTLVPAWLAANLIRGYHYGDDMVQGAWLLLFVFSLVWAADIGAYFVGKAFGRLKLMPNVSPNKTIEGFAGGAIASFALVFIASHTPLLSDISAFSITVIAAAVIIASVLGDLLESMLKRQAGVKDSGNILPGHGGILDRVDSLTAALPVFAFLFYYIR